MSEYQEQKSGMTRREMLMGAGAVLAAAGTPNVFAMDANHDHSMHTSKHKSLIEATLHCIRDGDACLDHCLGFFRQGDTAMADCATSVTHMLAMCSSMQKMASYNSKYAAELASVCLKVCKDCEKECNKHAKKHAVCAACARSCKECIKECKRIAA